MMKRKILKTSNFFFDCSVKIQKLCYNNSAVSCSIRKKILRDSWTVLI